MKTQLLTEDELNTGAKLIQAGELVAFPTDTVYGLGADATNEDAVKKVYEAKGRPTDRPINVLIGQVEDIFKYAKEISQEALNLAKAFWPGPLTLILKSADSLAPSITANKETVGLRIPDNEIAIKFINECNVPLATPSANSSGRPSPTLAEHVLDDLNGKIAAVIDGGATAYGLESTILDLSNINQPIILRPGQISKKEIEAVLNREVQEYEATTQEDSSGKEKHYEPKVPVYLVESDWETAISKASNMNKKIGLLASHSIINKYQEKVVASFSLGEKEDIESANRYLFEGLRTLEVSQANIILAEVYPRNGKSLPYMNRLESAANKKNI